MIDQLVSTYGPDALLRVQPNLLEDGEIVGWIVEVDGQSEDGLSARVVGDDEIHALLLVRGDDEVELERCKSGGERAGYIEKLGELQARASASSERTRAARSS